MPRSTKGRGLKGQRKAAAVAGRGSARSSRSSTRGQVSHVGHRTGHYHVSATVAGKAGSSRRARVKTAARTVVRLNKRALKELERH